MPARKSASRSPRIAGIEELSFYLGRAYYHYCLVLEEALRRHGVAHCLRPGMGPVIFPLFEKDDCTLRELGEISDLSPSTVTEMVQKLEKAGVVARRQCAADARAVRVRLTARGHALRETAEAISREINGLLQRGMAAGEVKGLKDFLAGMIDRMRAHRAAGRAPKKSARRSKAPLSNSPSRRPK